MHEATRIRCDRRRLPLRLSPREISLEASFIKYMFLDLEEILQ